MGETILSNQIAETMRKAARRPRVVHALGVMGGKFCVAVG